MSRLGLAPGLVRWVWDHPGNAGHRARGLSRLAGWQVWQVVTRRPWTVTLCGDRRLRCYPHSAASGVLYSGLPDWTEMHFVLDYLRAGDTFVDVGANVGVYSLLASAVPGVRVVAFEPSRQAWERLVENVALNGLTAADVEVVQAAVGEATGTVSLTIGRDATNKVVAPGDLVEMNGPVEQVDQVTLDAALTASRARAAAPVALVKIDVEGREADVLRGARRLLEADSPALLIENNHPGALAEELAGIGYTFHAYDPASRSLADIDPIRTRDPNVIAVRDLARAAERLRAGRRPPSLAR